MIKVFLGRSIGLSESNQLDPWVDILVGTRSGRFQPPKQGSGQIVHTLS